MSYHSNDLNEALKQAKANAAWAKLPRYVHSAISGIGTPRYYIEKAPVGTEHYQVFPDGRVLHVRECSYLEESADAAS